jgi:hypothetical protein
MKQNPSASIKQRRLYSRRAQLEKPVERPVEMPGVNQAVESSGQMLNNSNMESRYAQEERSNLEFCAGSYVFLLASPRSSG